MPFCSDGIVPDAAGYVRLDEATTCAGTRMVSACPIRNPMRRRLLTLMGLWIVALIGPAGCQRREAEIQMPERPPAAVTVSVAIRRDVPVYLDQIGRTVPVQTVAIVPQVGGRVMATHVEHGDYVSQGQLLFEIDPRPFQAALDSAKAALALGQAELELARTELRRVSEAVQADAVSRLEYDQKRSSVDMAQAKVAEAQAAVEAAELDMEYSRIYAPINGKAGARLVDAGNVVRANDRPLLMVQQMDPIFAEFTVTENELATVRSFLPTRGMDVAEAREEGLDAMVDIPADSARLLGVLSAVPGQDARETTAGAPATQPQARRQGPRRGTLSFLDNVVDRQTGTIKMRVTLPNTDRYFWPGQFVNVRLILTEKTNAVLVPVEARQIGQQGPYVYVVNDQGIAEQRPIVPGQRHGEWLVVVTGVQAGEQVVITGHRMVMPGRPVQVRE